MSEEMDDFFEDQFEFGGWSYTPQEKACIRTKRDISQRGRSEILENLSDVSIRFYGQVLTQYKIETEKLAKKIYEERLDYEVSRDNKLQISENDYKQLFLKELAIVDGERKKIEEEHESVRLEIKNHLISEYQSYILGKLEHIEWKNLKPTINAELDAKCRFAARVPEEINRDAQIEMAEQDYINAYFDTLNYLDDYVKKEIKFAFCSMYYNKIKVVLSNYIYSDDRYSEWVQFKKKHDVYHCENAAYTGIDPHKLYSNSEITDNILFCGEWEIYDSLKQASETEYHLDKVRYAAQSFFDNRTPYEIIRDDKALITFEDYFEWCKIVWGVINSFGFKADKGKLLRLLF